MPGKLQTCCQQSYHHHLLCYLVESHTLGASLHLATLSIRTAPSGIGRACLYAAARPFMLAVKAATDAHTKAVTGTVPSKYEGLCGKGQSIDYFLSSCQSSTADAAFGLDRIKDLLLI